MGVLSNQRVRVMTWTERNRLTFLTAMHVVDDLYQGGSPGAAAVPGPGAPLQLRRAVAPGREAMWRRMPHEHR